MIPSRPGRSGGRLSAAAAALCFSVFLFVSAAVAFCWEGTEFNFKSTMPVLPCSRPVFTLAALGAGLLLCLLRPKRRTGRQGGGRLVLAFLSLLLFCWQAAVCRCARFDQRMDDVYYILNSAMALGRGETQFVERAYLQLCPNNITITALYGYLLRGFMALSGREPGPDSLRIGLILLQSAANVLTCALAAAAAGRITGSRRALWTAWLLALVLVGLSPWFLVPYTDSTGLIFPMLLFMLWLRVREKPALPRFALLGAVLGLTYIIKPHAAAAGAAALVCLALRPPEGRGIPAGLALCAACCLLVAGPCNRALHDSLHLGIDEGRGLGAAHYFNMGLNTQTDGCFSDEDRAFALTFSTPAEQTRGALASAGSRIAGMGAGGLARHLLKKTLVNCSDGTFSWCTDFNRVDRPAADRLSRFIRALVYDDGALYPALASLQQLCWQLVLLAMPLLFFCERRARGKTRDALLMLMLCAAGILAFNLLMEAKARYLYTMVPLFCVGAACALSLFPFDSGAKGE